MNNQANTDQMTPKERMTAFAAGLPVDRLPCIPLVGDHAQRLLGGSMPHYYFSAKLMAEAQIRAFRLYRCDAIGNGPGLFGIAEGMGTKLAYPENDVPYVDEPALKDWADLEALPTIDPYSSGRLPICLESLEIIKETVGEQVDVGSFVGGPFTTAAAVRGTEHLLKDLLRRPEAVHRLLQLVTDNTLRFIDAVCDLGLTPGIADPTSSGTLISDKYFREFAKPYLQQCVDRIRERTGSGPMLHICGDTSRIWTDMADTGAGVLSLDNQVDLAAAKDVVGDRVCLVGNVRPAETMWRGTPDDVLQEAKACIGKAADNPGGYILSTGCGLPLDTPPQNVQALMEAARLYGKMPINREMLI